MVDNQTKHDVGGVQAEAINPGDPKLVVLDPRGDLKLHNGNLLFLVSSSVLMLSSDYFRKMLQTESFEEGAVQPQRSAPPTKVLRDDSPDSFGLMCRLLHFQPAPSPSDVESLSMFASVCDYYGTELALSAHVQKWLRPYEESRDQLTIQQLEKLFWVAFVFRLEDAFSTFSVALAVSQKPEATNARLPSLMPLAVSGGSFYQPTTVCVLCSLII